MAEDRKPLVLRKIKQTCARSPSQWEGLTDDNRPVYIRYRHGWLSVGVGEPGQAIIDAVDLDNWFGEDLKRDDQNAIDLDEVCRLAAIVSPARLDVSLKLSAAVFEEIVVFPSDTLHSLFGAGAAPNPLNNTTSIRFELEQEPPKHLADKSYVLTIKKPDGTVASERGSRAHWREHFKCFNDLMDRIEG